MPQSFSSARIVFFAVLTVFFVLGVYELMPSLTPATAEEGLDGVEEETEGPFAIGHTGMPSSNNRVRPILVGHRNKFVVVCVAGCRGGAKAVQVLPKPANRRSALFTPAAKSNDVICLAGCEKSPGEVVQRFQGPRNDSAHQNLPVAPERKANAPFNPIR